MRSQLTLAGRANEWQRGQMMVIAVLAFVFLVIPGVALVVEGGNAYAHQRVAQNATDSVANAGATVLAQRLGGATKTDADVLAAMNTMASANAVDSFDAYYTDVAGQLLTTAGLPAANTGTAAQVGPADGDTTIPPNAQGVQASAHQTFGTTFARVPPIGITQFTASADATSVTGALIGGEFLPLVLPVNVVDCSQNGDVGIGESNWVLSQPDGPDANVYPDGPEYIVPLCKTGGGSFMILDLDGIKNNCDSEVTNPPAIQFDSFPVDIASDNGNNCAGKMVDAINALSGTVVLIPICDGACVTGGGSNAQYHIIKVAALYLDYMSDTNNKNNPLCQTHIGASGQQLTTIRGNGSSSCIAGWFVRYVTSGPIGPGGVTGTGAIGVQLIK